MCAKRSSKRWNVCNPVVSTWRPLRQYICIATWLLSDEKTCSEVLFGQIYFSISILTEVHLRGSENKWNKQEDASKCKFVWGDANGCKDMSSTWAKHLCISQEMTAVVTKALWRHVVRTLQCSQCDSPLLISCWPPSGSHTASHESRRTESRPPADPQQIERGGKTWLPHHHEPRRRGDLSLAAVHDMIRCERWRCQAYQILHCPGLTSNWTGGQLVYS